MKTLLIIGIGNVALKYLDQALQRQGLRAVVLGRRAGLCRAMEPYLRGVCWYDVDADDDAALEAEIRLHPRRYANVWAVTTLYDERFPAVLRLGQQFGWRTPPYCLAQLSAKRRVQAFIPEYSPPSLCFRADEAATVDLAAAARWGEQVIVKPALASGGLGIAYLPSVALRPRLLEHLAAQGGPGDAQWLLQRCLDGRLLSFEGYAFDGSLRRLGISSRSRLGLTEVGNRFPVCEGVPTAVREAGWACIQQLLERAGLNFGYFHCEFIQGLDHLWLIDANAGRIGGATLLEQIAQAYQLNTADLLAHVLLLPLLEAAAPCPFAAIQAEPQATLGIWYGCPASARLEHLDAAVVQCCHTQFAAEGHRVPAVGSSDHAWVGMLSGEPRRVLQAIEQISLLTDRGRFKPAYCLD